MYGDSLAPGFTLNSNGKNDLKKWARTFSVDEIMHAMDVGAESYLEFIDTNCVTEDSWDKAFNKLPGICRVERESKKNPEIRNLYYIRGIARNRCEYYFNNYKALEMLKVAISWGVSVEELREIACNISSWTQFRNRINDAIDYQDTIRNTSDN